MTKLAWFLIIINLVWNFMLTVGVSRADRQTYKSYLANDQTNKRLDRLERDIEQGEKSFAIHFENEMNKRWKDFFPNLRPSGY